MANVASLASAAISAGKGILRLAPTWVPRSFLQPGRRLKLHPDYYYALGMHRGGIDERWFGSTTEAANDNRNHDEGLSYVVHEGRRFLLRDAVSELKSEITSKAAADGITFENTGTEPLVTLRYFGPDAQAKAPNVGDHKKQK